MSEDSNMAILSARVSEASVALGKLEKALEPFYRTAPHLFPKPLKEMGASEKMSLGNSIILIVKVSRDA